MAINVALLDTIPETSYLATDKTVHYRAIMRIFYEQAERSHHQLSEEDVLALLREIPEFSDYSLDLLTLELKQLCTWKNLTPIQDPRRATTIIAYQKRNYLYFMSEAAKEVERMTLNLEGLHFRSSAVSGDLFYRIERQLTDMPRQPGRSAKDIDGWWQVFQDDFERMSQNYQDYLHHFYSADTEKLMHSTEFLAYKQRLLSYLRDFVQEMQDWSGKIQESLRRISPQTVQQVLDAVCQSRAEAPHSEQGEDYVRQLRERLEDQWQSIRQWFLPAPDRLSDCQTVLETTNEIIRKILQNANLIVQLQGGGISRKEDYRHYLKLFAGCEDVRQAHCLSAWVFGTQKIEKFVVNDARDGESITSSTYEESSYHYECIPSTRAYTPRIDKTGFADKTLEKEIQRQQLLARRAEEQEQAMRYIRQGTVALGAITEPLQPEIRQMFLGWIATALATGQGITQFGQHYTLTRAEESDILLPCEDGTLQMPPFVLRFTQGETDE